MSVATSPLHSQHLGASLGFSAYISASGDYLFEGNALRDRQSSVLTDFTSQLQSPAVGPLNSLAGQYTVVILSTTRSERGQIRFRERYGRCEAVVQRVADGVQHYFSIQKASLDVGAGFMSRFYRYKSDAEDLLARCLFYNVSLSFGSADECGMLDGVLFTLPIKFETQSGKSIILLFEKRVGRRLFCDLSYSLAYQHYLAEPAEAAPETRRVFAFNAVLLGRRQRDVVLRIKFVSGAVFCSISFQDKKKVFELSRVTCDPENTRSSVDPSDRARSASQRKHRMKSLRFHAQDRSFAMCFPKEEYTELCALLISFGLMPTRFYGRHAGQDSSRAASAPPRRSATSRSSYALSY